MGLQLNKQLTNGDTVTYWRIVRFDHTAKDGTGVVLGGFDNKEKSDTYGDEAVKDVENFHFELGKDDFINSNPYEQAYSLIRESRLDENGVETNVWASAEDV